MVRTTERGFFGNLLKGKHEEGGFARPLEEITAKVPSDTYLWLGWASVALSLFLWVRGRQRDATLVGLWAPMFLLHGVYSKLIRQSGHERYERD